MLLGRIPAFSRLHAAGYAGRKNRRGFYAYGNGAKKSKHKQVNEAVYVVVGGAPRRTMSADVMARRLALLMINEAVYCLALKSGYPIDRSLPDRQLRLDPFPTELLAPL